MGQETPTLTQVLKEAIDARLVETHTAFPGKVVSYDSLTQLASIQPLLQRQYKDGRLVNLPVINSVPVSFPRGGGFFMSFPLKPDDEVLLVISERSLDVWKEKGGIVDPLDPRKFHLSDAFAIAGIGSKPNQIPNASSEHIVLAHQTGIAEIFVKEDGKVSIKSSELLLGDHVLAEFVAIASRVEARLASIEAKLTAHITAYNLHTHTETSMITTPPIVPDTPFVPDASVVASAKVKVST